MSALVDRLKREVPDTIMNYEGKHRTVTDGWVTHNAGTRVGSCLACLEAFLEQHPED